MKLLNNMKIATKVLALLLFSAAITLVVAIESSSSLSSIDDHYSVLIMNKMPVPTKLARANRLAYQEVYLGYQALTYPGGSARTQNNPAAEQKAYESAVALIDESEKLQPAIASELDKARARLDQIHELARQAIALGITDRNDEARPLLEKADNLIATFSTELAKLNDDRIEEARHMSEALSKESNASAIWTLAISIAGLVLGIVVSILVSRFGIVRPLGQLEKAMRELANGNNRLDIPGDDRGDEVGTMAKTVVVFRDNAQAQEAAEAAKEAAQADQRLVVDTLSESLGELARGNLTAEITREFPADYQLVRTNFNAAVESLRTLIGAVMESAASIRTGSGEIAQASEDLARRTESNAASLEETSAAVSQMDGRLKATAEAAQRTVARADGAISTVTGGRGIADEAVQAMTRVSDSAKGIDSVIEGLDKIAFQTRVLAMNAAVEAGRAGDAGRGFAVVADLVSALAMRAEEEAKRARDQLTVTQTDIVTAVEAVTRVDGALADISEGVGEVHQLLGRIADDNQAQSSAITQISAAIGTMDQATQQNAAMVEQTSAAARNLSTEVTALAEQASRFDTGAQPMQVSAPRVVPAALKPARKPAAPKASKAPAALVASAAPSNAGDDWAAF